MTYPEALKYLARKYGIEVHEQEESAEDTADRLKRESMIAVSEFASKFYADALFNTAEGHSVGLSYFRQKRGFSDETIRKFGLGWSPSGRTFAGEPAAATLPRTALQNGYKAEYLLLPAFHRPLLRAWGRAGRQVPGEGHFPDTFPQRTGDSLRRQDPEGGQDGGQVPQFARE